jgi:hypothetical protein
MVSLNLFDDRPTETNLLKKLNSKVEGILLLTVIRLPAQPILLCFTFLFITIINKEERIDYSPPQLASEY